DSRGLRLASGLVLHVPNGFFLLKRRSEDSVTSMRLTSTLLISSLLASSPLWAQDGDLKFDYHGAGWLQMGRVENSFALPNSGNDYGNNWLGNAGAVINVKTKVDENWDAAFGIGTIMVHLARGSRGVANKWYPFWVPFVAEARFTYATIGF